MKTIIFLIQFTLLIKASMAQSIPADSLYLGQVLPGDTPIIFKLEVTKGLIAAERIAITFNNKEIYYGELDSWPPKIQRIKCYKYIDNKWRGPFVAFEGYIAPSLSENDSIIYMQKNINLNNNSISCTFYSLREKTGWTNPKRLLSTDNDTHYFQKTKQNNFYTASSLPDSSGSNSDLCKLVIHNNDTTIQSLGPPINSSATENDFYIAKDESYIILCRFSNGSASDLFISFRNSNGDWTTSIKLGTLINTPNPNWEACPYVTKDNKYLFFMRGGNDLSSYFIYWVSIDKLIKSLKPSKS
ncbi:MAG: hypothetical protein A2W99_07435 [Bacteroidetes bacterium GWF2_33_16]|nr:MAG: hypothetical protein A2X00_10385 [Bacteroidetes bacterium GWE2_32_14]OFY03040.1 MAG: hypothetical protein A2W99_07435 [Bacteroidetes bacterium GWF2_33_16]